VDCYEETCAKIVKTENCARRGIPFIYWYDILLVKMKGMLLKLNEHFNSYVKISLKIYYSTSTHCIKPMDKFTISYYNA